MRIHNLYEDEDGQSHFRDIEVEWVEEGRGGKLSAEDPGRPESPPDAAMTSAFLLGLRASLGPG